jgi:hypothetical protein
MKNNCLNCNENINGKYCSNCSQIASIHRFSLSHFFAHDFVHGIFHFDKGFLFTIKELFTRPGHGIREYVQGKRVKHFNYFATIILLSTIGYFLKKWSKIDVSELFDDKTLIIGYLRILKDYSKFVVFLHIPLISFASYLLFKKSKQNYTENLVLNLFLLCGLTTINFLLPLSMTFSSDKALLILINRSLTYLNFAYIIIFYYQYFFVFGYKKINLIIRIIIIAILYVLTKQITNNILNIIGLKYFH